jgi:hypothetical protein
MREQFSSEEWSILSALPVHVFIRVAGADSNIDDAEMAQMKDSLRDAAQCEDALLAALLHDLHAQDLELAIARAAGVTQRDLDKARHLLQARLGAQRYQEFASTLYAHGERIAQASGGFLGVGSKMSGSEKRALQSLAQTLGIAGK